MKYLVTGGAGYVGSFMTKRLLDDGHSVVVVDSLEKGYKEALPDKANFIQGTLFDKSFIQKVFDTHTFDGVFHFAAYISVGESMQMPGKYFTNNFIASLNLLETMVEYKVKNIIFSSTAAVYGNPQTVPIPEDHSKRPESPYGESKLMVEALLRWYHQIYGIRYVALRYFNACGASLDGRMGENHNPETHIIPNAILAAIENKEFTLFGSDYPTKDGTCVRDYIHVLDLIDAHSKGMNSLLGGSEVGIFNVGTGKGYSNKVIVEEIERVSGRLIKIKHMPRRLGDPAELIADTSEIRTKLEFNPQYSDLTTIVSSAWLWHTKNKK